MNNVAGQDDEADMDEIITVARDSWTLDRSRRPDLVHCLAIAVDHWTDRGRQLEESA